VFGKSPKSVNDSAKDESGMPSQIRQPNGYQGLARSHSSRPAELSDAIEPAVLAHFGYRPGSGRGFFLRITQLENGSMNGRGMAYLNLVMKYSINPPRFSFLGCVAPAILYCIASQCAHAQDNASFERQAVALYPDLAQEGTALHGKFIELYNRDRQTGSPILNQADWPLVLAKQAATALAIEKSRQNAAPTPASVAQATPFSLKGLRTGVPITRRYGMTTDDYFKGSLGKKLFKYYDNARSIVDDEDRALFQRCNEAVNWKTQESMVIYCPESWNGTDKLGVFINIPQDDQPVEPLPGYSDVMDGLKMIYVSLSSAGDKQADMRRAALALDALATVRKQYPVDETRLFIGGINGGGTVAGMMMAIYPEFRGAICQLHPFRLGDPNFSPYLSAGDIQKIAARKQSVAFVARKGDPWHDGTEWIVTLWPGWGIAAKMIGTDGEPHTPPTADALKEALDWALDNSQPPGVNGSSDDLSN